MCADSSFCETLHRLAPQTDAAAGLRHRAILQLIETAGKVRHALRSQLARKGLTMEGFQVLAVLRRGEPVAASPGLLVQETGTARARLSHTLTRLEFSGLIVRQRDLDDRRAVWIRLTAAGRKTVETAIAAYHESILQLGSPFTQGDLASLIAACAKLDRRAEHLS